MCGCMYVYECMCVYDTYMYMTQLHGNCTCVCGCMYVYECMCVYECVYVYDTVTWKLYMCVWNNVCI